MTDRLSGTTCTHFKYTFIIVLPVGNLVIFTYNMFHMFLQSQTKFTLNPFSITQ